MVWAQDYEPRPLHGMRRDSLLYCVHSSEAIIHIDGLSMMTAAHGYLASKSTAFCFTDILAMNNEAETQKVTLVMQ